MDSPVIWQLNQLVHIFLAGGTVVLVALWPSCRSKLLLILAIAFGAVPSVLWFLFLLVQSFGEVEAGRLLVPVQALSLLTGLAGAVTLLIFAILMRNELAEIYEAGRAADLESPGEEDSLSPPAGPGPGFP